jgi:hypothetical protein
MEMVMSKMRLVCVAAALIAYALAVASVIALHEAVGQSASLQSRPTTLKPEIGSRAGPRLIRVASLETGNLPKPWPAPVGHRQPKAADVMATLPDSPDFVDRENASVDHKIRGVCVGC